MNYRSLTLGGLLVRALLVLIVAAIAAFVAFALSERQPKRYQAQTKLAYGIALRPELQETKRLANQAMEELLHLARQLRPTALDDHGLIPALASQVEDFSQRTGIDARFSRHGQVPPRKPAPHSIVLSREAR